MTRVSGQGHTCLILRELCPHICVEPMPRPETRISLCLLLSLFFATSTLAFAQGARIRHLAPAAGSEDVNATQTEAGSDAQAQAERRGSDGDHPAERQDWFRSGRRAMGEHAADLLHRAYVQKQSIRPSQRILRSAARSSVNTANPGQNTANGFPPPLPPNYLGSWTPLGPAPITSDPQQDYGAVVGRVTSVVVDQGDTSGNTVYIGAAFGGVWKSTNAAATDPTTVKWTPLTDDQPTLAVGAITIQPGTTGNSEVVLVGTGEPNSSGDSYYGMGILRSTNGGQGWAPIIRTADNGTKAFSGLGASGFAWSSANPNLVVVGMGSTNGKHEGSDSIGGRGIYYSQDAGQSWHYASVIDPGGAVLSEGSVTAVAYNPGSNKFYAAYRYHGFYESSDGINWTRMANQPDATGNLTVANCPTGQFAQPNPTGKCPLYRAQFAVQPSTKTMYVVYVNDSDLDEGVYAASVSNGSLSAWQQFRSGPCKDPAVAGCPAASSPIWGSDPAATHNPGIEETGFEVLQTPVPGSLIQGDYNLWIGAVPTAQGTDLLVGTRNIYRCSITSGNPTCSVQGAWKDLTHVYTCTSQGQGGVGAPAHVHPDQHGYDFSVANPQAMYFVNDGGVNRSLNGTTSGDGTCTPAQGNPFQNLDANMGSLSEMVSFSQHPSNPNVLLGGLQDNGSPSFTLPAGMQPIQSPQPWLTANLGDGGYNEIDPTTPGTTAPNNLPGDAIWYSENTGVSVQQCDSTNTQNGPGIQDAEHCNPGAFGAPPYPSQTSNIGSPQVAHDTSEFYMPFILDPADGAKGANRDIILGTCRVFRGPGFGGATWQDASSNPNKMISPVFDSSATAPCGDFSTKIRAIAAGGPPTSFSQVDGSPQSVMHNVSTVIYVGLEGAGTATASGSNLGQVWVNTDAANPTPNLLLAAWHEIDQNAHIAATSNGGLGPYPIADIQVDAHDPTGKTAYVAVEGFGVSHLWKTTDAGQSWTDLTNNLPDAPADSIAIDPDNPDVLYLGTDVGAFVSLNNGATWDILGTNLPNVPVTKMRVFGSNAAPPKMIRVSTYGRGVWQLILPAVAPADLSPGLLDFGTQLVGPNSAAQETATFTNNTNSTVTISSISIVPPTGAGYSRINSVPNNCGAALASFASCQILISFTPPAMGVSNATLTVAHNAGNSPQSIFLTGTGSLLSVTPSSLSFSASVGNPSAIQNVQVLNNGTVPVGLSNLAISSSAFVQTSNCPAALAGGQSCSIPVSFSPPVAGSMNATLTFSDGSSNTVRTISLTGSASDFGLAIAGNGPSATVTAGQAATYTLNVAGINNFNGTVNFTCSGLPTGATCNNPSALVNGPNAVPVTLTISTPPHSSAQPGGISGMTMPFSGGGGSARALYFALLLGGCVALALRMRGRARTPVYAVLMLAGALMFSPACGGGGGGGGNNNSPPPPTTPAPPPPTPQTSTVTVTATSGNRTQSVNLTLNVN